MYKLDITYSWDDAEEGMQFTSFQKAWEKAKELAMKEVETISIEHGAESGLFINGDRVQEKGTITYTCTTILIVIIAQVMCMTKMR